MTDWTCVLTRSEKRDVINGSAQALAEAIGRGADLRVYTEFMHNEHVDVSSSRSELVREVAEFGVTYRLERRWAAGIMSLRQPISLPDGFGPRPSMSFFLYNQDGRQSIARPFLDGVSPAGEPGRSPADGFPGMAKYHALDSWDAATNAPSSNFIYDFNIFRFCVNDAWQEVLSQDADSSVRSGSVDALAEAFSSGCEVKVGVEEICGDLALPGEPVVRHELFVQVGSCYYYTREKLFIAGSHPVVRVRPGIPMRYESGAWDFGWLMLRSDGHVVYRRCDPYTLKFSDREMRAGMRWFVR